MLMGYSINSLAFDIEIQTNSSNNILFIYSGYGKSQLNNCNDLFFNQLNTLNNFNSFSLYFDILYSDFNNYVKFLEKKSLLLNYNKLILFNLYSLSPCLNAFLLDYSIFNSNIYFIGFVNNFNIPNVLLKYDMELIFRFLDKLNLNLSKDVFYFTNVDSDDGIIVSELKSIQNINLNIIRIKTDGELRHNLIRINKNPNKSILIFNLTYLYSDIYVNLISINEILEQINTYNRIHIPVNLGSMCISINSLLALNLMFDYKELMMSINEIINTNQNQIINSKLVISLPHFYKLQMDINLNTRDYKSLFDQVYRLY